MRTNSTLLSPVVLFPLLWIVGVLLAQIHLLSAQFRWSQTMIAVAITVPVAFYLGGLLGSCISLNVTSRPNLIRRHVSPRAVRVILLIMVVIGFAELAHQFMKIGGVPLLSSDGNIIRFNQGGPSIVLVNLLTVAGLIAFTLPRDLFATESRFELGIILLCIMAALLQASRGSIVLLLFAGIAARWIYWGRPKISLIFVALVAAVSIVSLGFFIRARQMVYMPFESEFFLDILPSVPFILRPLLPIYLGLTVSFYGLQQIVSHFPDIIPFGAGAYNSIGLDRFIPGSLSISAVSEEISSPWITSTIAGALWADGGLPVVAFGSLLGGFVSGVVFSAAVRTRSIGWSAASGYILYTALFGLYTNLWTQQVDWVMVTLGVVIMGTFMKPKPRDNILDSVRRLSVPRRLSMVLKLVIASLATLTLLAVIVSLLPPRPLESAKSAIVRNPTSSGDPIGVVSNGAYRGVYWVKKRSDRWRVLLRGDLSNHRVPVTIGAIPASRSPGTFLVGPLVGSGGLGLWELRQLTGRVQVRVTPMSKLMHYGHADLEQREFSIRLGKGEASSTRQFLIVNWDGREPDIATIDQSAPSRRPLIRIFSGESGFREMLLNRTLPVYVRKDNLWSFVIGSIDGRGASDRNPTPAIVALRRRIRDRDFEIRVLSRILDPKAPVYRREVDIPINPDAIPVPVVGKDRGVPILGTVGRVGTDVRIDWFDLDEARSVAATASY